jgi:hypothetical protein
MPKKVRQNFPISTRRLKNLQDPCAWCSSRASGSVIGFEPILSYAIDRPGLQTHQHINVTGTRVGGKRGEKTSYLNPVMGRITTSSTNLLFPPSYNPVRAFHLKPAASSSQDCVDTVMASGPVRSRGSRRFNSLNAEGDLKVPPWWLATSCNRCSRVSMNRPSTGCCGAEASAHWVNWIGFV